MDLPSEYAKGQRLTAADVNRLTRAAQELARQLEAAPAALRTLKGQAAGGVVIQVCNDTGETLYPQQVAGLDDVVFQTAILSEPVIVHLVMPTAAHAGKFAVVLDEIPDQGIGRAMIYGVAVVKINLTSTAHDHAEIAADQVAYLESGATGSAEILWSEGEVGEVWGVVRFPVSAATSSTSVVQMVKAQATGASGVVSVKNITLKADVAASPNYVEDGTAYNVNYYKEV